MEFLGEEIFPQQRNHRTNEKGVNKNGKRLPCEQYTSLCLPSGCQAGTNCTAVPKGLLRLEVSAAGPGLPSAHPCPALDLHPQSRAQGPCQAQPWCWAVMADVLCKGEPRAAAPSLVPRDHSPSALRAMCKDHTQQLTPPRHHRIKLTKLTPILFFLYFLPGFLLLPLCLSQVAWCEKSSPFMMKSAGPGEALTAEHPANGQKQLVFLLPVHTLLNTTLSSASLTDTHTSSCFTRH